MRIGIGSTLREARTRREVGLAEVEAATKIRGRYLRAIEAEDWEVLPGGPYTRGFIRTYAAYLGLDGERLAEEYSREVGGEGPAQRVEPVGGGPGRGRRRVPGRVVTVLVSLALVALLVAIGLVGRDDDGSPAPPAPAPARQAESGESGGERTTVTARPGVAVSLAATAEVWVCLLDSREVPLVNGQILEAGAEAGPFRDEGFVVAFGNGEVELTVDGRRAPTPPSASPVGYSIDSDGDLTPLVEGERPECT